MTTGERLSAGSAENVGANRKRVSEPVLSRRRWVTTAAVAAVLLAGGGVAASSVIKSPAQVTADTAPPPPDVLSAAVEKRVLKDTVILRGTVTAGESVDVAPVLAETGDSGSRTVVTKLPVRPGDSVTAGEVVVEVSGRPFFVLKGELPVYRDLRPGSEGDDVKQLQEALTSLGQQTGRDAPGVFGDGTKRALGAFYRTIGYDPLPASPDEQQKIEAAQDAVTAARRAHEDAQQAFGSAVRLPRASVPTAAGDGKSVVALTGLETALNRAAEDLRKAEGALARTQAAAGPMLPSGEVTFLRGFPAHVAKVSSSVGAPADGVLLTLAAGRLVVHGYVQEAQKGLIRSGHPVEILSESSGGVVQAEVRSVADAAATSSGTQGDAASGGEGEGTAARPAAATPDGYQIVVEPGEPLSSKMLGEDVRLTIETGSTEREALVVPVTAISSGADGKSSVTVLEPDGVRRRVAVTVGAGGDGYVAVVPVSSSSLAPGSKVITGVRGAIGD